MERLIEFRNRTGRLLRGMLHQPDELQRRPPPGAVFFHGFTGDRMESHWLFVKCSRAFANAGIASLRFDFMGSGESEGLFCEASLETEIADAEDAAAFLRREGGIDAERLGLLGLSLGGGIAALIAERVGASALVLWAAIAHLGQLRELAERLASSLPGTDGELEYSGHRISAKFLEAVDRLRPLTALAGFTAPTLIVHPERDEYLPLSHAEDYLRASAATIKEKIIVPGADHTFTSIAWEREVITRAVDWFGRYL